MRCASLALGGTLLVAAANSQRPHWLPDVGSAWSVWDGYYLAPHALYLSCEHGHYADRVLALRACELNSRCSAVATEKGICGGEYRLTVDVDQELVAFSELGSELAMHVYTLDRSSLSEGIRPHIKRSLGSSTPLPPPPSPPPPSPPPPSPPAPCTDEPSTWMTEQDPPLTCDSWSWGLSKYCNKSPVWESGNICQTSCWIAGYGYQTDVCFPPPPAVPPVPPVSPPYNTCTNIASSWMDKQDPPLTCTTWSWGMKTYCNKNDVWISANTCEFSCWDAGYGYSGTDCSPSPPAAPPPPICSDEPTSWMEKQDPPLTCAGWSYGIKKECNKNADWIAANYCQFSCWEAGFGYPGDNCLGEEPAPPPLPPPGACTDTPTSWMEKQDPPLTCAGWSYGIKKECNKNADWNATKYCQQSCYAAGLGYEGDSCVPATCTTTCTDEASSYMEKNGLTCADWGWGIETYCNKDEWWSQSMFCQASCDAAGFGYPGVVCCPTLAPTTAPTTAPTPGVP